MFDRYSDEELGISEDDIAKVGPEFDDSTRKGNILKSRVNWLSLRRQDIPEHWNAKIARQEIVFEVTNVRQSNNRRITSYLDSVYVTYAIEIPEDARGMRGVTLTLYSKPGELTKTVNFIVSARDVTVANANP